MVVDSARRRVKEGACETPGLLAKLMTRLALAPVENTRCRMQNKCMNLK